MELNSITLAGRPSLVESNGYRFLIFDAPKEENLPQYLLECKKQNVSHLVRVCQQTYPSSQVESAGISMHEMEYADGTNPPDDIIEKWLDVVEDCFGPKPASAAASDGAAPCLGVHCVAGLGRAPVLVAIALVEFTGMDPVEAVAMIRKQRRGAINSKQLFWLERYRPSRGGTGCSNACIIL
mmetsp:Transcript_43814/g.137627  ORF Transcript_43814/g.137627 Transcript_43814/m.137627 type:complete len:182 (-) Transcript_43814:441-986(-)